MSLPELLAAALLGLTAPGGIDVRHDLTYVWGVSHYRLRASGDLGP